MKDSYLSGRSRDYRFVNTPALLEGNQEIQDHVDDGKCDSVYSDDCRSVHENAATQNMSFSLHSEFGATTQKAPTFADASSPTSLQHEISQVKEGKIPKGHPIDKETPSMCSPMDMLGPFLYPSTLDSTSGPAAEPATTVLYTYYPFLTVNNASQSFPQDFNFLEVEGCFHVPTKLVLDDLVHQYFVNVHPHLPLLSEADFWDSYHGNGPHPKPKLSLLVFQAMLFAASNVSSANPTQR